MLGQIALLLVLPALVGASVPSVAQIRRTSTRPLAVSRMSQLGRREFAAAGVAAGVVAPMLRPGGPAEAAGDRTVLVAGATGKTGRLICRELCARGGSKVLAGVRNDKKASEVGVGCATPVHLDVTEDVEKIAASLKGADTVICALGFVPGNPFQMNAAAHAVDNVGTCSLIDACGVAGVKKFVLITSILTDGRSWGQADSPGFKITNAFGSVLDEKLVAEKYLRGSKLDYTIIRPAGLRDAEDGQLAVSGENTLNSGEVSRTNVARVCAEAVFAPGSSNKVVEIVEELTGTPKDKWFA